MNRVRELRKAKKLTLKGLADLVGLDFTQISKIERGIARFNSDTIPRFAAALGVDIADLFRDPDTVAENAEKLQQLSDTTGQSIRAFLDAIGNAIDERDYDLAITALEMLIARCKKLESEAILSSDEEIEPIKRG